MSVIVRNKGGTFVPAPEGLHHSVCVDAVDLGMVDGTFGRKHMIKLVWQTKQQMHDGKPYLIQKRYNASLNPKANLRIDLESWRGRKFSEEEAKEMDLEKLIGVNCQITVAHAVKDGNTYGNVLSIVAAPSVLGKLYPQDYTRVCKRPGYEAPIVEDEQAPEPGEQDGPPADVTEDDIPF